MSKSPAVRYSRDGDQFHYLWAARRCLRLLSPKDGLTAITIENSSLQETQTGESVEAGEEQIDVGEYYGSEKLTEATFVRYVQLKHSTKNPTQPWAPSSLEKTIRGFAEKFQELEKCFKEGGFTTRVEFCFFSNRPINANLRGVVEDTGLGNASRDPTTLGKLEEFTSLSGERLSAFCRLLKLEGMVDNYWIQRADLGRETNGYLPGNDIGAPIQLKELVTRKALSESRYNPSITKIDVLRVLGATEDDIFPAPCCIASAEDAVARSQEADIVDRIINANTSVVLHAEGGVGKSVFSQRIRFHLPENSVAVVYDCFGNGEYRRPGSPRHRHKDALVQIANELAALGLCDPLIPVSNADETDYLRAFFHRLKQSVGVVKARNEQGLLCVIVDAADNAEIAAKELGNERAFARDLLREPLPDGVRLVVLCRTERQALLDVPASVLRLELEPFSRVETALFLRKTHAEASDFDVDEFHRLTSHNPRVQATALGQDIPLPATLLSLGPNPTTVDDTISALLQQTVDKLRENIGSAEQVRFNSICTALATLRPFVPVPVLASVSDVAPAAVRSFATDLGGPILIMEDAIQFRDEPVETWFHENFRPDVERLSEFIQRLQPLAQESSYVASTLPQLMLEAGQLNELIDIALSSSLLPVNLIERQDVEIQRFQFALKASLRTGRFADAAKLALKAAQETTGDTRRKTLLRENTDLVARLLEPDRIREIVARRTFDDRAGTFGQGTTQKTWTGSHHAYEASLLSYLPDFQGDARSRLRTASEWLMNWSRLPHEERKKEEVTNADIAEIAIAHFNIHGPEACAAELRRWKPKEVSYRAGRIVARRLVDQGRHHDLDQLALAATDDVFLLLAINFELRTVRRYPPETSVELALGLVRSQHAQIERGNSDSSEIVLQSIIALVESAHLYQLRDNHVLASILQRHLPKTPPHGLVSRFSRLRFTLLRAYALQASFKGENLQLVDVAPPEFREKLESEEALHASEQLREFKNVIGVLLPWHKRWAENLLDSKDNPPSEATTGRALWESANAAWGERPDTTEEIVEIWFDMLTGGDEIEETALEQFNAWIEGVRYPLYVPTWIRLARLAVHTPNLESLAYKFIRRAFERVNEQKEDADSKAQMYVELARTIFSADQSEAKEYFNQAIEVTSKIGDEVHDRWTALLDLADHAALPDQPCSKTAYKFARCAELAYQYVYRDKHFPWEDTVEAIAALCPPSCFAILSRWRDRNFGSSERLIATATHFLLDRRLIDPKTAAALVGFRANWAYGDLVKSMFAACPSRPVREETLNFVLRYARLDDTSSSTWKNLKRAAEENALTIPEIDRLIEHGSRRETTFDKANQWHGIGSTGSKNKTEFDWDALFSDLDLHTSNGLSRAYANYRSNAPPFHDEEFFFELFQRVPIGKAAEVIRVFPDVAEFSPYCYEPFLEQLPKEWKSLLAVKSSVATATNELCLRYCMEIIKSRYWQPGYRPLPLRLAAKLSGTLEKDLIRDVVTAIGERGEVFSAGRLFSLVGLLAPQLSHNEALDALNFGLDLFNDLLDENDGDGPWTATLEPPPGINTAIAGYIWGALAAPQAGLRWESAHVVLGLCVLGRQDVLDDLVEFARDKTGKMYADSRLHFYHLHGRQWLMIAFARAACEHPERLAPYMDFFIHYALEDEPHVVIRHFAARSALALVESENIEISADTITRLAFVNNSTFPFESTDRYRRVNQSRGRESGTKRFNFGYDTSKYWFEDLGRCFGKGSSDIQVEAEKVICSGWSLSENGYRHRDERYRRDIFQDRETRYSHSSYPVTDDLNFYLSYHAMMIVAGKLLATIPRHQDPKHPNNEFEEWLGRHLLSRHDGYWLSDRRDPAPLEWPRWKDEGQDGEWTLSVENSDFRRVLGFGEDKLNLSGYWQAVSGQREETVYISSALVTSDRSFALLRALQTATDSRDYRIPGAGDGFEIDEPGFRLKGWVENCSSETGRDELDPWTGGIQYPPLKPAKFVRDIFQLKTDKQCRVWQIEIEGVQEEVLWAQVWGNDRSQENHYYETEGEHGRRLQASHAFIAEVLGKVSMDLITEVQIGRRVLRHSHKGSEDDFPGYSHPYTKIFIFKADGRTYSL